MERFRCFFVVREVAEACGNGGTVLSNSGQLSFLTFLGGVQHAVPYVR